MAAELSLSNPVFKLFAYYSTIVLVKYLLLLPLTALIRTTRKKYSNPEDAKAFGNAKSTEDVKRMGATDSTVERVKRVVQNDIENIYAFMALAPLYVLTAPALNTALWVFRLFTGARVAHTVCYLLSLQPFRGICWIINISINFYMAYCIYQSCAK